MNRPEEGECRQRKGEERWETPVRRPASSPVDFWAGARANVWGWRLWTAVVFALAALLAAGGWLLGRRGGTGVDRTWLQIQERGSWRVGMDPSFPPFASLDGEGAPVGYDVDLAREIAAHWGLEAEIVAISYDSLADALREDRVDAVVSAFPFDARLTREVHFSPPYFEAGVRLAATSDAAFADIGQLDGRRLAVEWGSRGDAAARRLQREGAGFERLPFQSSAEAIDALVSGQSDALLIDGVSLRLAQGEGRPLIVLGEALESDPYVIAVSIKAFQLQEEIFKALAALEGEKRMEALEHLWFGRLHVED